MVHILDDFLIIETSQESAIQKRKLFIQLCEEMGVPLSAVKTVLPTQTIAFVGVTLDALATKVRFPLEKRKKCNNLLKNMQQIITFSGGYFFEISGGLMCDFFSNVRLVDR